MKKLAVLVLIGLFIVTGCTVKKVKELTPAEKFSSEFGVSSKNPFLYAKYDDIVNIMDTDGIFLLANPDDEGSVKAVKIITKVAKDNNIEKIYYYNPKKIKKNKKK